MSTGHKIEVIRIGEITKHPNADTLGLVQIYGYTCAVKLGEFKPGDMAVYIEPDMVVPDEPQYSFLGSNRRIKARRLRGHWSQGLIIPAPKGAKEGQDVMASLGITRWIPPAERAAALAAPKPVTLRTRIYSLASHIRAFVLALPALWASLGKLTKEPVHESLREFRVYDLDNYRKGEGGRPNSAAISAGEHVIVTEKIHGTNARYAYRDGRMYCGSRNEWKPHGENWYWKALQDNPWIAEFCVGNPDAILFGEVYGVQKGFPYDTQGDELRFRAFDIWRGGKWADAWEVVAAFSADRRVPVLHDGPFSAEQVEPLADGNTLCGDHMREGIVIKPKIERRDPILGRVALKLVSNAYLERNE